MSELSSIRRGTVVVPRHRLWIPPPPPLDLGTPLVMPDLATLIRVAEALRAL